MLPSNIINTFFAPIQPDLLIGLIRSYSADIKQLNCVHEFMSKPDNKYAFNMFLRSAESKINKDVYDLDETIKLLNSDYWDRALKLTDVYEHMPQNRRDEWNTQIRERSCPVFEEETVFNTMKDLLHNRSRYIAERVDGIFKGLSGEHVTNSPSGFGKRMILNNVLDKWASTNYTKCGYIDDLRKIVAKLLNREEPKHGTSSTKIRSQVNYTGDWFDWDGGSLRVRIYKKGTAHIEVHPDIAWQLNQILAFLYPQALSHASIRKPSKVNKDFKVINTPISDDIIQALSSGYLRGKVFEPSHTLSEKVSNILYSIGGVKTKIKRKSSFGHNMIDFHAIEFDYFPNEAIAKIIVTGELPDKQTHQFYPTPKELVTDLIELACIEETHSVLEPSAGQGNIADQVIGSLDCYELSELHCTILKNKGHSVTNCDFLKIEPTKLYDRIVMNPPFSEGRAKLHLEHAIKFLKPGGKLVAILPSSYNKVIDNVKYFSYSDIYFNKFEDACVNVVMLTIIK